MSFSAKLKKFIATLMLTGVGLWFAGCSESSSTPKTSTTGGSTPPKVNSDGSVKATGTATDETSAGSSSSSSSDGDETETPAADGAGDDEQAGSSTGIGGRDVPEADPAGDDADAKSKDEPKDE